MKKEKIINKPLITIITPTTGKDSLFDLIESISKQGVPVTHMLLWDDKRDGRFNPNNTNEIMNPNNLDNENYWEKYNYQIQNIILKGKFTQGQAYGSALRAVGLMAANTDFVTFADDDIIWEDDHLITMLNSLNKNNWAYCKRKIWAKLSNNEFEYLGIDEFESMGEEALTEYKMVDNNSMIFKRRFGVSAACLYRETKEYNDDRLMYKFLMKYAGKPGKTNKATVNQTCPQKLEKFFRENCTK